MKLLLAIIFLSLLLNSEVKKHTENKNVNIYTDAEEHAIGVEKKVGEDAIKIESDAKSGFYPKIVYQNDAFPKTTPSISGKAVLKPSADFLPSSPVKNLVILLTDTKKNERFKTITNSQGLFKINVREKRLYRLSIRSSKYRLLLRGQVIIRAGKSILIPLALK